MTNKSRNSEPQQEFKVPPAFKFQEGEKVLCFHGPLIYEAKCLQARYDEEEKTNKYHIHYSGWNKSWDEWVPESRVLKHNDGNIQRQKELHKAQKAEPKGKKGKKRSVSGKERDADGKEKDADDSRSSTPIIEKGGGKASASATQSSSQESASDIPKRKRSKLDPSVETSDGKAFKKGPLVTSSAWKVNLSGTKHLKSSRAGGEKSSSTVSQDKKKTSPIKKKSSPKKFPVKPSKAASSVKPPKKLPAPAKSLKRSSRNSIRSPPSPSKYPGMNGKKLRISVVKLDMNEFDETGRITSAMNRVESQEFGNLVARKLEGIPEEARRNELKTRIMDVLRRDEKKRRIK